MGANQFKERLKQDSFLWFGQCALSLKAPKDPVSTPQGYIYDREFILEYLLKEKKKLAEDKDKFDAQEAKKERSQKAAARAEKDAVLRQFHNTETAISVKDELGAKAHVAIEQKKVGLSRGKAQTSVEIDHVEARSKSFWAPEANTSAAPEELKKPDLIPKCPMSGKKLRLKELIPMKLERVGGVDDGPGMFCCAVSKRPITYQQAYLIKPSGIVIEDETHKQLIKGKEQMRCPLTSVRLGDRDIVKLNQGGSSFSEHSNVEMKGSLAAHGLGVGVESDGRLLKGAVGGTGMWR